MRLLVREKVDAAGLDISKIGRRANITMATARRYYYGTSNGREDGEPLETLNTKVLAALAAALNCSVRDLVVLEDVPA